MSVLISIYCIASYKNYVLLILSLLFRIFSAFCTTLYHTYLHQSLPCTQSPIIRHVQHSIRHEVDLPQCQLLLSSQYIQILFVVHDYQKMNMIICYNTESLMCTENLMGGQLRLLVSDTYQGLPTPQLQLEYIKSFTTAEPFMQIETKNYYFVLLQTNRFKIVKNAKSRINFIILFSSCSQF